MDIFHLEYCELRGLDPSDLDRLEPERPEPRKHEFVDPTAG